MFRNLRSEITTQTVLQVVVRVPDTPVLFNVRSTRGVWLPGFIESFKDNNVDTPASNSTDSIFPEVLSVLDRWNRVFEGSLHDIVKEGVSGVILGLTLPVREGVGKDHISGDNGWVGSTVNNDIPGINETDLDTTVGVTFGIFDISN
ncbi:hypothetical protein WICPIJ_000306 [Wickerhamomyces pijperi]|uniref:Uncharacterized protein n=1 Tax=Wickerhamomyces pijperi TaxID=599730 RepID=A0A9P8QE49_WICPI|nr:hypothetical protein WICPIJ_000306 [Wickerhamomyces pijperi]